jgi:recombination protein RecT
MSDLRKFNADLTNEKTQKYLSDVLGTRKASFVNNIVALVSNNVKLQECEPITLMFAALKATALNLPLDQNLGYAYIIPYRDNKAKTTLAQFQIGKNGFVQLALRSNQFKTINVSDVCAGELKSMDRLSGECIFEWKEDRISIPVIGYVAYMKLLSGFEKALYMTMKEIEVHGKKYSKTYTNGPWKDDFASMAEKTVIKRLLSKYAPLSVEMQQAISSDQAILTEAGAIYIDNDTNKQVKIDGGEKKKALKAKQDSDEKPEGDKTTTQPNLL